MEAVAQMPTWSLIMIQVLTLVVGGGAVWAYLTRRHETDAERVARFEGRLDARLDASERDRDALRAQVADLDKRLGDALRDLRDARDALVDLEDTRSERDALLVQNRGLVELLRAHDVDIPAALLIPPLRTKTTPAATVTT